MTSQQAAGEAKSRSRKRRWAQRVVVTLVALVVVLSLLVLLLPTAVSTGPGRIEATRLRLGWFTGQAADGLRLVDPQGRNVASIDSVWLPDTTLWSLVKGSFVLGELRARRLVIELLRHDDGTTNLSRVFTVPEVRPGATNAHETSRYDRGSTARRSGQLPRDLSFELDVNDVTIFYHSADRLPIVLALPMAHVKAIDPHELTIDMEGRIEQGELSGSFQAKARVHNLFDTDGRLQLHKAELEATAVATDLSIAAVDQVLRQEGRLVTLLGATLTTNLTAKGTLGQLEATFQADSPRLSANAKVQLSPSRFQGEPAKLMTFTLSPDAWQQLTGEKTVARSRLLDDVVVRIQLDQFEAPVEDARIVWPDAGLGLTISMSDLTLEVDGVGQILLSETSGTIEADALGKSIVAHLRSIAGLNNHPGEMRIDAKIRDLLTAEGRLNHTGFLAQVTGYLNHAPITVALDEILKDMTKGLLVAALGATVDAKWEVELAPTGDFGPFKVELRSPHLQTDLVGKASTELLELESPSQMRFQLRPELIDQWRSATAPNRHPIPAGPRVGLAQPADVTIHIDHLSVPLTDFSLDRVTAALSVAVDQLVPAGDERLAGLSVRGAMLELPRSSLGDELPLQANATIHYEQSSATLKSRHVLRLGGDGGAQVRLVRSSTTLEGVYPRSHWT